MPVCADPVDEVWVGVGCAMIVVGMYGLVEEDEESIGMLVTGGCSEVDVLLGGS